MAKFEKDKVVAVTTPQVKVEISGQDQLEIGANRFRLTVIDDADNISKPTFLDVIVKDDKAPTAVLDLVDARGRRLPEPVVGQGDDILLSGARSADLPPGKVVKYNFAWVDRG